VYLLRGVPDAGLMWAGLIEASAYTVAGVDAGDASNDDLPDVVVAWSTATDGVAQVFHGDGLWGFDRSSRIELLNIPTSVTLDDTANAGKDQLVVLQEDRWQRFLMLSDGTYAEVGPPLPIELPSGAFFQSGGDANGDGGEELVMVTPRISGRDRSVIVLDLFGADIEYLERALPAAHTAFVDGNGDGYLDVWMRPEGGSLSVMAWVLSSAIAWDLGALPDEGPFAVGDVLSPQGRMFLAGQRRWSWHRGQLGADVWRLATPATSEVSDKTLAFDVVDDGSPESVQLIAVQTRLDSAWLRSWRISRETLVRTELQDIPIGDIDLTVDDMAVCEDVVVIATDDGVVTVNTVGGSWSAHPRPDLIATAVACVPTSSPSTAVLTDGVVTWLDSNGNTVDSEPALGASDLAVMDASGTPQLHTCTSDGCSIEVWWPTDSAELFTVEDGVVTLASGDTIPLSGRVFHDDIDLDGLDDLFSIEEPTEVTVLLTVDGAPRVEHAFHGLANTGRWAAVSDLDGDGVVDLWALNGNAEVEVSGAVGVNEIDPPDTGSDTGSDTSPAPDTDTHDDTGKTTDSP